MQAVMGNKESIILHDFMLFRRGGYGYPISGACGKDHLKPNIL
jgi:hypothetical protein